MPGEMRSVSKSGQDIINQSRKESVVIRTAKEGNISKIPTVTYQSSPGGKTTLESMWNATKEFWNSTKEFWSLLSQGEWKLAFGIKKLDKEEVKEIVSEVQKELGLQDVPCDIDKGNFKKIFAEKLSIGKEKNIALKEAAEEVLKNMGLESKISEQTNKVSDGNEPSRDKDVQNDNTKNLVKQKVVQEFMGSSSVQKLVEDGRKDFISKEREKLEGRYKAGRQLGKSHETLLKELKSYIYAKDDTSGKSLNGFLESEEKQLEAAVDSWKNKYADIKSPSINDVLGPDDKFRRIKTELSNQEENILPPSSEQLKFVLNNVSQNRELPYDQISTLEKGNRELTNETKDTVQQRGLSVRDVNPSLSYAQLPLLIANTPMLVSVVSILEKRADEETGLQTNHQRLQQSGHEFSSENVSVRDLCKDIHVINEKIKLKEAFEKAVLENEDFAQLPDIQKELAENTHSLKALKEQRAILSDMVSQLKVIEACDKRLSVLEEVLEGISPEQKNLLTAIAEEIKTELKILKETNPTASLSPSDTAVIKITNLFEVNEG